MCASLNASTTSDVIITPCTKGYAQSSISNNTPCKPVIAAGISNKQRMTVNKSIKEKEGEGKRV